MSIPTGLSYVFLETMQLFEKGFKGAVGAVRGAEKRVEAGLENLIHESFHAILFTTETLQSRFQGWQSRFLRREQAGESSDVRDVVQQSLPVQPSVDESERSHELSPLSQQIYARPRSDWPDCGQFPHFVLELCSSGHFSVFELFEYLSTDKMHWKAIGNTQPVRSLKSLLIENVMLQALEILQQKGAKLDVEPDQQKVVGAFISQLALGQNTKVLNFLLKHYPEVFSEALLRRADENFDLPLLKFLWAHAPHLLEKIQAFPLQLVHVAALEGDLIQLQEIYEKNGEEALKMPISQGRNIAHIAARGGHLHVLKWLHQHLGDDFIRAVCIPYSNIAFQAAEKGHLDILDWVEAHFTDLLDSSQEEAIHVGLVAAKHGQIKILEWLKINNHADLLAAKEHVNSPEEIASVFNQVDVLEWLRQQDV